MAEVHLRNTVLESVELFRKLDVPRGFLSFVTFLYVAENEGVTITELASLVGVRVATAARLALVLAGQKPDEPVGSEGILIEFRIDEQDRRMKFVYLTEAGRRLRARIDGLIAARRPIAA